MKEQKGITLIALVITIIVLLILAGVSINAVLGENGIITKANNASKTILKKEIREKIELGVSEYNIEKTTASSLYPEDIIEGLEYIKTDDSKNCDVFKYEDKIVEIFYGDDGLVTDVEIIENENNVTLPEKITLKVGDYVNYTPDLGTYEISEMVTGYGTLVENTNEVQVFKTQERNNKLKWRVLSIDESTGKITIISDKPSTDVLFLSGANGYNHGVDVLNDMCESLYSSSKLNVKARSVNENDILPKYTYDPTTFYDRTTASSYKSNYRFSIFKLSSNKYIYYPSLYAYEDGTTADGITGTGIQTSDGIRKSDGTADYTSYKGYSSGSISNVTSTSYWFELNKYRNDKLDINVVPDDLLNTGSDWWVASRYVFAYNGYVTWGIRKCGNYLFSVSTLFAINSTAYDINHPVRPVVELPTNIKLEYDIYNSTDDTIYWNIK